MILLFVLRISGKLFFDSGVFNYMDQLGSVVISGYVNIVARNETAVHFSGLAFLLADNIFSTRWWNSTSWLVLKTLNEEK